MALSQKHVDSLLKYGRVVGGTWKKREYMSTENCREGIMRSIIGSLFLNYNEQKDMDQYLIEIFHLRIVEITKSSYFSGVLIVDWQPPTFPLIAIHTHTHNHTHMYICVR